MFELIIIIICIAINALLAASETAFIAVSRPALRELSRQGNEKAKILFAFRENPERMLSVIQVGITFVGALAAAVGGAGAEETITPWLVAHFGINESFAEILAMLAVVTPLTYVSVVLGELVPKTFALKRPLFLAFKTAPWLNVISRFIDPIVTALEWSTKKIVNLFPAHHVIHEDSSQHESSIELNALSAPNRQYVLNIFKIEKTSVKEILIGWSQVTYIDDSQTIEQVESIIISSAHTRLPVVRDNEVIGIINAKEFLAFQKTGQTDWLSLIRSPIRIPINLPMLSALQVMQAQRAHMAIVYSGNTKVGLVTMEAIFEEIIGDIYDEEDDGTLTRILNSIHFKKR
ncbi:MAG: HlyC/CorC family transporter [Parachlamydiaceae bacterium]|nr:HlyC/CorC family transporter [Parachlamydiaceae bacterium]